MLSLTISTSHKIDLIRRTLVETLHVTTANFVAKKNLLKPKLLLVQSALPPGDRIGHHIDGIVEV